ncbi:hypothetical protein B0H11DRAFT_2256711 [Mycena galericulata]|nr:hypothetical protein B0H11DRAFT_2256711 [Mycena galericulata]
MSPPLLPPPMPVQGGPFFLFVVFSGLLIPAALFSDNSDHVTAHAVDGVTPTAPTATVVGESDPPPHNNGNLTGPNPYLSNPESENPSSNAADFAPPLYVKEGTPAGVHTPWTVGGPPPPRINPAYSSPPHGPPPPAHISPTSEDFNGGFHPLAP